MRTHPRRLCGGFVTDYFSLLIFRKLFQSEFVYWWKWTPAEISKWIPNQINSSSPVRPPNERRLPLRSDRKWSWLFSHYPIHLSPCLAISDPPTALYSLLFSSSFNLYMRLDCLVGYVCVTDLKIHTTNDITALPVLWDCGWGREQHSCCWEDVMAAPFTKCCVMILPHKPITMGLATHTTCSLDSCITSFSVVCRAVIVCLIT